jgi:putative endonuclease
MKTYYVYILRCADNSYYTGITNDIDRRLSEHQEGDSPTSYTFTRRPVKLVFIERFVDINVAIDFEKQIKGWSRKKKEALIERNYNKLKELSACTNTTSHTNYRN